MLADEDYMTCCNCGGSVCDAEDMKYERLHEMSCECTHVSIDTCKEKGYSVVNIRCRDRPKLLFDTVCALTDMQYMVFHAAISSNSSIAVQEYYVRRKDGCTLNTEKERRKVSQCLIAAVERRGTQGLKLDITAKDRTGLLSDVTRVFRENGLSVTRAEIGTRGEKATGTFYVTDASGFKISKEMVEAMEKEIGGTIVLHDKSLNKNRNYNDTNGKDDKPSLLSLGSFLWSRLERISGNFGPIWS